MKLNEVPADMKQSNSFSHSHNRTTNIYSSHSIGFVYLARLLLLLLLALPFSDGIALATASTAFARIFLVETSRQKIIANLFRLHVKHDDACDYTL